jgi:single-strand DNA-binding protein
MTLSKIIVSGKVIRAPEKRFTPNTNVAVTEFSISVESNPRPDGSTESTPVKIVTWRDLAERCAQEIKKGDLVAVDGRLQINNYATSEGQRKRDVEIDAVGVENLSTSVSKNAGSTEDYPEATFSQVGAKATPKPVSRTANDDLDSIFASEDEIPF